MALPSPLPRELPHPLPDRLIEAGLGLLATEGIEALSLRRVAREAGVSHGAPLRHFTSFSDLRSEIAARGFRLLRGAVQRAREAAGPDARAADRLAAAGRAYIEAATENPALFALMFRPEQLEPRNETYRRESLAAFEQLVASVHEAQSEGVRPEDDTRRLAGVVWANVHGLATLWSQGALRGPVPGSSLEELLEITLDLVRPDPSGDVT